MDVLVALSGYILIATIISLVLIQKIKIDTIRIKECYCNINFNMPIKIVCRFFLLDVK